MATSSRFTHVSLGSLEDKIQLNVRQLQILEQRRQRLGESNVTVDLKNSKVFLSNKLDPVKEWASLEATHTAPTTSWESDATSAVSRTLDAKSSFFSQQQQQQKSQKERKKFYDDEGASYYDSASDASRSTGLSHKQLETASTALTETLTKTSSHESSYSALSKAPESGPAASEAPSVKLSVKLHSASGGASTTTSSNHKVLDMKAHLKKRFMTNMAEKRKEQGKQPIESQDRSKDRRQSLGLNRPKTTNGADENQRAFLRTLMQSAYQPKEEPITTTKASAYKEKPIALSNRESAANSATMSGNTSSSAASAEDKAIMRKVLERSRKKKTFVKTSTSRMKKMKITLPSRSSPRSQISDESANDERSVSVQPTSMQPRRSVTPKKPGQNPGRRTPQRREKTSRSPRLLTAISRWSAAGSRADDEAESPTASINRDISESTTEELASDMSDSEKQSVRNPNAPCEKNSSASIVSTEGEKAPSAVDIKRQTTDVSAISRKSTKELDNETPSQRRLKELMSFDEGSMSNGRSSASRPSIECSGSFARAVTESLMEPIDMDSPTQPHLRDQFRISPKTNVPFSIPESEELENMFDEDEAEGYAEFVATLKTEVAGSHSRLWESFHGLFHENEAAPPLSNQESIRFDDKTKDLVTSMSTYLKQNYPVTCTTGAQVANDQAVSENPLYGQHLLKSSKDSPQGGSVGRSFDDYDSYKQNGGALMQAPSTDASSINAGGVDSNEIEVTLGQFVRKSMGGKVKVPEKKRPVQLAKNVMKQSSVKPILDAQQITPQNGASTTTAPWSGVKLRSVTDANKSETSISTIPTSWAKVKLRPVSTKSEKTKYRDGSVSGDIVDSEEDDSSNFRRILVSKKPIGAPSPKKTPKKTDEPEVIEIIDLVHAPSTEENPIDLANVASNEDDPINLVSETNEDMPIDLTCAATPRTITDLQSRADTKATSMTIDGSVLVSLAPEPNSDPVKILIGKKGLVKVRSKPGETKAQVVWRLDIDDVRSALLDLAAFKVKLLLDSSDDNKDLTFETSEQCMRFANALHEMTISSKTDDKTESASSTEESVFVEQLNEEEQRVLEEFRQNKKVALALAPPFSIDTHAVERPMSTVNAHVNGLSSPLSEISGPGSALSSADLRVALSYQKMLKLGIPKDAVRHKMDKDDINAKVIEYVLGAETGVEEDSSSGDILNREDEVLAASYTRMLKMRIPVEEVRHKMEKEGVDVKIIRYVLGDGTPQPQEDNAFVTTPTLSADEEQVAASYRKMLKMMIPKEAVMHKMQKDQVDSKIITAVVGETFTKSVLKTSAVPTLTDEEESVASSYRKMLALRIPKEVVRHKMESEGITSKIIASVLGEKMKEEDTKRFSNKKGKQSFHWKPVSSEKLKNSVWSKSSFDSGLLDDDVTISSHVELFQKRLDNDEVSRVTAKSSSSSKDKAKLIDLGRANNVAITLKAFNDVSEKELAQIIEFVDPFEKIKGDRALFMKDLLPASAEIKVIKSYKGADDRLVPAEKWFRQIVHINRIEEKIHVLRTMESFRNEAISLGETFQRLTKVCDQVMNSEKLPDLLEMVRQIGNRMNDDRGQEAAGFKLDFLPRLAQTKGSDKTTTALDLVVMIFNQRGRRAALLLSQDFPDCYEVSRIQFGELLSDVQMLNGAMRKCQTELNSLRKEAGKPPRTRAAPSDSHSDSGVVKNKSNNSTRSNDEVCTQVSSMHEELFAKRAQFISSVIDKGLPDHENVLPGLQVGDGLKSPRLNIEISYSYQGAINRIESFIEEAQILIHELEAKRDKAMASCKELVEFFCESGGERMAPTLLGILSEFANNLNTALVKYDQQQKAEARKKASRDKSAKNNIPSTSMKLNSKDKSNNSSTFQEKKSLVLMVNEMLKVAGDKQKADFMNGLTYEHPDSRLKQIYEVEKRLGKPVGSPATDRRNILRTIEERRRLHGTSDSQAALSELAMAMQSRTTSNDSMSPTVRTLDTSGCDDSFSCSESSTSKYNFEEVPPLLQQRTGQKSQRMSIAERWTRKAQVEVEDEVEEEFVFQTGESPLIRKTDSQILASDSHDSEDRKYEDKKRQEYISRWANQNAPLKSDKSNNDIENESDGGSIMSHHKKTRQQYMNRWASKPTDDDTEEESLSLCTDNL